MRLLAGIIRRISSLVVFGIVFVIRLYQCTLSHYLGGQCRFVPTCSEYCIEALRNHGVFRGIFMGVRRIIRCNPFSGGGFDPVP